MACNCASNMREKIEDHFIGHQLRTIKRYQREGEKALLRIEDDHTKFLMKIILFFLSNTLNQKKEDQIPNADATIPKNPSDEIKNNSDSQSDVQNESSTEDREKREKKRKN